MNNWGGSRPNSGRPTKSEEQKLIEDLDGVIDRKEAIRLLWSQMQNGNMRAFSIYFDRRFGKVKPILDNSLNALQRFEVEVVGGQREDIFKTLVENIKFEDGTAGL